LCDFLTWVFLLLTSLTILGWSKINGKWEKKPVAGKIGADFSPRLIQALAWLGNPQQYVLFLFRFWLIALCAYQHQ